MKRIYLVRDVGVGVTHGFYSSRTKAQKRAQELLERWGVKQLEYKPHSLLEFYWIHDEDVKRTGIVLEVELLQ